ncbi:MAG: hypothetical protein A2146_05435 [Actinobacteria bacterium RBG_16_67_10]|nr:MAG: hypothetical protein A2146_05435 [Actinobacteria bacterium RBG_16_67_10]
MPAPSDPATLAAAAADGDRRALARLITALEEGVSGHEQALAVSFAAAVPAHRIGITGSPGAGKSTLTDCLVRLIRAAGERVAVLAVDPTSPFSGGAVLGDRVRMQDHVLDDGVYVRSMASRGHLGGLSAAAPKALLALEAARFPYVIVETVGVGQDEVEIAAAADTVVVVVTPGWGDGVQTAKAGILEIGDVFSVNKADRPGTADTVADLRGMLSLGNHGAWEPPIVETVATTGSGVEALWAAIRSHHSTLGPQGVERQRTGRRRAEMITALADILHGRAIHLAEGSDVTAAVAAGEIDPWTGARLLAG